MSNQHDAVPDVPPTAYPITTPDPLAAEEQPPAVTGTDRPPVGAGYIWLLILATFGVYVAFVTPIAISLAIKVDQIAPGNEASLGYVLGIGSLAAMLVGPLVGVLSDRTRSRLGRRKPWIIAGTVVGTLALVLIAQASTIPVLILGWVLAQIGWSTVVSTLLTTQADRLPESQRGKVGGLNGFATMAGPVIGSAIGGSLATQPLLLFLIPGAIGVLFAALFVLFIRESDTRVATFDHQLSANLLAKKYLYDPRRYPDYSWNWLGRFLFNFGLTLNTAFTAFFFADRLGLDVTAIGGVVAIAGLLGVLATITGAIGGGFLSDRVRRRRVFVLTGGVAFAAGALLQAASTSLPMLLTGTFVAAIGIGIFSAVDQALLLDVLPERDTDAGRFMGINGFSTTLPQAVAPLLAPAILAIGAAESLNYPLLYVIAAVFTVAGGLVILLRVRSVN